jgi:hypothetical protein
MSGNTVTIDVSRSGCLSHKVLFISLFWVAFAIKRRAQKRKHCNKRCFAFRVPFTLSVVHFMFWAAFA